MPDGSPGVPAGPEHSGAVGPGRRAAPLRQHGWVFRADRDSRPLVRCGSCLKLSRKSTLEEASLAAFYDECPGQSSSVLEALHPARQHSIVVFSRLSDDGFFLGCVKCHATMETLPRALGLPCEGFPTAGRTNSWVRLGAGKHPKSGSSGGIDYAIGVPVQPRMPGSEGPHPAS